MGMIGPCQPCDLILLLTTTSCPCTSNHPNSPMKAQLFLLALVGMFLRERFPSASKVCAVIVVLTIGEKVMWFVQHRRRFARLVHSQIDMHVLYGDI